MRVHRKVALEHATLGTERFDACLAGARTGRDGCEAPAELPAGSEVMPGYVTVLGYLAAPPGTPAAVVQKLSAATVETMRMPEVIDGYTRPFRDPRD